MGTNFYAHIIPTQKRKEELKALIDSDDWEIIREEIDNTFGSFHPYAMEEPLTGYIHLGKRSSGWKFLWNPNIYLIRNGHTEWTEGKSGSSHGHWVPEPDTARYIYPLTKQGIKNFIDREDVEVWDEYDNKQDKETFWQEALDWDKDWRGKEPWDGRAYHQYQLEKEPRYQPYRCTGDYIDLLKKEGFQFTDSYNIDFYSDGLRFSSSNDFS